MSVFSVCLIFRLILWAGHADLLTLTVPLPIFWAALPVSRAFTWIPLFAWPSLRFARRWIETFPPVWAAGVAGLWLAGNAWCQWLTVSLTPTMALFLCAGFVCRIISWLIQFASFGKVHQLTGFAWFSMVPNAFSAQIDTILLTRSAFLSIPIAKITVLMETALIAI